MSASLKNLERLDRAGMIDRETEVGRLLGNELDALRAERDRVLLLDAAAKELVAVLDAKEEAEFLEKERIEFLRSVGAPV